jgi:hypothetical protein
LQWAERREIANILRGYKNFASPFEGELHMTWHAALLSIIGGIAALIAAVCWFWSSRIEVPANQDTFIDVLQRIGYWNNKAALAACVAALFQGASLIL